MQSGFDINELFQEARHRWLKPAEVFFILQNHENHQLTETIPQKPPGGSLFLYNKRVLRYFRKDGHIWRKKKAGRTVGEGHERLKVGNAEALNCYYAHGEQNPNFQRRSYWMLDPAYDYIVLVHYREISEGRHSTGSTSHMSPGCSSTLSQSPKFYTAQNQGSTSAVSKLCEPYRSSFSSGSVEISSELFIANNGMNHLDGTDRSREFSSSPEAEVEALRRIEEQLSLKDEEIAEFSLHCRQNEKSKDSAVLDHERTNLDELVALQYGSAYRENNQSFSGNVGILDDSNSSLFLQSSGENKSERKESPFWKEMQEQYSGSTWTVSRDKNLDTVDGSEKLLSSSERGEISANLVDQQENLMSQWLDLSGNNAENRSNCLPTFENNLSLQLSADSPFLLSPASTSLLLENENYKVSADSFGASTHEANPDYYAMWFDQENQLGASLGADSSLTPAQKQAFSIQEISPDWGYANEDTKVIIAGSFLCDPSECTWTCMFGDIEVPAQIIQGGVLRCQAPPHIPGKVSLCISSGNREPCSEVRDFEYRIIPRRCDHCSLPQSDATRSTDELLLLVRFSQLLKYDPLVQKEDSVESGSSRLRELKIDEDPGGHIMEALLVASETPSSTMDWFLQELLKEKLQLWLSSKYQEGDTPGYSLLKKEQGIIHLVAALGFEWALNPIVNAGVSINFRDFHGWTALHWAARFGREKMVAALIAAGASAGAVTDPTPQDPTGKTPGSIAADYGHKGLAGYLSEVALTSHLLSLTLEESEISKGSAVMEAEKTVDSISKGSLDSTEDHVSLEHSLAAVRNAAQAAARIQSAFRERSFRIRQQREAAATAAAAIYDEYGITLDDIHGLLATSKLAFRLRDYKLHKAALLIQKKYRGWKGRKEFVALRQKVVMIQAHVRGYQVRKKYKVILWAVGVLDKVVLRWCRRGAGLRGFQPEPGSINESEYEDLLKVFRKQKVDVAIEEALSRVLSMVESPEARKQYRRMLESYWLAKVESSGNASETVSMSQGDGSNMESENNELIQFPIGALLGSP